MEEQNEAAPEATTEDETSVLEQPFAPPETADEVTEVDDELDDDEGEDDSDEDDSDDDDDEDDE